MASVNRSSHDALFQRYIGDAVRAVLASIEAHFSEPPTHEPHEEFRYHPPLTDALKARALHTLTYAFKLPELWDDTRRLMLVLAPEMEKAGHRRDWLPYLERGAMLANKLNDTNAEVELSIYIGYVYQLSGDYDDAYEWFAKSVSLAEYIDEPTCFARSLNCLAYIAKLQRRFDEARSLVDQAIALVEHTQSAESAHANYILGTVEQEVGNPEEAVQLFEMALKMRLALGDPQRVARCYRGLGTAYHAQEKYNEAIIYTRMAISMFEQTNDMVDLAVAEMNLGTALLCQGDLAKARTYYQRAEPILHTAMDRQHLSMIYNNIGYSYYLEKSWQNAIDAYEQSIDLKKEINDVAGLVNTLEGLGLVYMESNQHQNAKDIFNTALAILSTQNDTYITDKYYDKISKHLMDL